MKELLTKMPQPEPVKEPVRMWGLLYNTNSGIIVQKIYGTKEDIENFMHPTYKGLVASSVEALTLTPDHRVIDNKLVEVKDESTER